MELYKIVSWAALKGTPINLVCLKPKFRVGLCCFFLRMLCMSLVFEWNWFQFAARLTKFKLRENTFNQMELRQSVITFTYILFFDLWFVFYFTVNNKKTVYKAAQILKFQMEFTNFSPNSVRIITVRWV